MLKNTIRDHMTPHPYTIGRAQTLAKAHELMRMHGIRHLPVLEGGRVVGVVSQRDLYLVETFGDAQAKEILVEEAMTTDVYAVTPRTHVTTAMREMADARIGSAVVVEDGHVVGMFTLVDALAAAVSLLS
jgi:acetoin utilization protein AcuB